MHVSAEPSPLRSGLYLADLTHRAEVPLLKFLTKRLNARNVLSAEESAIMSKVKEEGMLPGENPLHEYMFFFSYHGICDLFSAHNPDQLHTLLKGLTVLNIEATVLLIYTLSEKSASCLGELDHRLKKASFQQAINPFSKKSAFPQGNLSTYYFFIIF